MRECNTYNVTKYDKNLLEVVSTSIQLKRKIKKKTGEEVKVQQDGHVSHIEITGTEGLFLVRDPKYDAYKKDPYRVISTDYKSYAIVYHCSNCLFNRIKREHVWVYTRKPLDP